MSEALVAVVSGKGGVGKTNLAANLAIAASGLGARVLLVDGDLGLANLDVLLGLSAPRSVADVLAGRCALEEALVVGPRGVQLLPAASGRPDLAGSAPCELLALLGPLAAAAHRYDLVLVDVGAGVGPTVVGLAGACTRALLVTTAEPTSLADAYAALKVLTRARPGLQIETVVNAARNEHEARETHDHLERLGRRFLGAAPRWRGYLPRDPRLIDAVASQRAVVEAFPTAPSSRRLVGLASDLLRDVRQARRTLPSPDA